MNTWEAKLSRTGCIESLAYRWDGHQENYVFRNDDYQGPQWYGVWDGGTHQVMLEPQASSRTRFEGKVGDLAFSLEYLFLADRLAIVARLRNDGQTPFQPEKAGLRMGLDTYMDSYPEWNGKLFPTLLRCEKTHFWGYAMSPEGVILGICSPDPIASWSLNYNRTEDHWSTDDTDSGHRIYTLNLDLLNAPPLPDRHPSHLHEIAAGQTKTWTLCLVPVRDLGSLKSTLARICSAPILGLDRYALAEGESTSIRVYCSEPVRLSVTGLDGVRANVAPQDETGGQSHKEGHQEFHYDTTDLTGVYTLLAVTASGKQSEAKLYVRRPWSWYLIRAREEALRSPQKASCCCESYYGHFSTFLARRHFPDPELDSKAEANYRSILALLYDLKAGIPKILPERIQNTYVMVSLLTDLYQAKGEIVDLELASKMADWIMSQQHEDGSYRGQNDTHYTSVVYGAKSILELAIVESELARKCDSWRKRFERHYLSARAAIDDLARREDKVGTEGEETFEDGMISCSALQLAMMALLVDDPKQRRKYSEAATLLLDKHRCLEQLCVPDCRMAGCTLRFWEAQYDVLIKNGMISSPHGWASWKTMATWYLYLVTGEERLLKETMDTLGACIQVMDESTGKLRWAFVQDPYVRASVWKHDPNDAGHGIRCTQVIGEDYVPMISDWWQTPPGTLTGGYWDQGGCCDNDVHEHFKCLEEVALTMSYVIEHEDGGFATWNCRAQLRGDVIRILPAEDVVDSVHCNLKGERKIAVHFTRAEPKIVHVKGMQWILKCGGSSCRISRRPRHMQL